MTEGTAKKSRKAHILLVDDNPAEVRLTREALIEGQISHRLSVAKDGELALRYLKGHGQHDAIHPDLILLDLNMPRKTGFEVLAEIKSDPGLQSIPVVVLTTSRNQADIIACYDLHANCYISKPIGLLQLVHTVKMIETFWLTVASLPGSPTGNKKCPSAVKGEAL